MFSPMMTLYTYFPLTFFLRIAFLLSLDIVVGVILYKQYKKNKIEKTRAVLFELLTVYTSVVMFLTVLSRRTLEYRRFGPDVFEYYDWLFVGKDMVDIAELTLNVLLFVPIGALLYIVLKRYRFSVTVCIGFLFSMVIELLQYILRNGYVSATDVIHNTLGTIVGALGSMVVLYVIRKIRVSKKGG